MDNFKTNELSALYKLQVQPTHAVIVIARNIFLLFRALENNSNRRRHFKFRNVQLFY